MSGLKVAALYGIKPHQLGFCGPQEKEATKILLDYLTGKDISEEKVKEILEGFEGAYPYYKLIAENNQIKDLFDERVVSAYWIGNDLLDSVSTEALKNMIITDFSRPGLLSKEIAEKKANEIPGGSIPHHSFHVLVLGSITGRVVLRGALLDLCRIGFGRITKLEPQRKRVKVFYRPLVADGNYRLGDPEKKYIDWDKNLIPQLNIGQQVSFHWNQLVQILTERDEKNLRKYTQQTLDTINRSLTKSR